MNIKNITLIIILFLLSCIVPAQDDKKKARAVFSNNEQTQNEKQEIQFDRYIEIIDSITSENKKRIAFADTLNK